MINESLETAREDKNDKHIADIKNIGEKKQEVITAIKNWLDQHKSELPCDIEIK